MSQRIQIRRGSSAQWADANPTLALGEWGLDFTLMRVKIGDGATPWASLDWADEASGGPYQPLDSDLTAIAALSTTSYGRALLALADAAAGRTALGLGSLATLSTITSSEITDGTIVAGDLADGAVTSAKILDGTIVNGDVSASAAIALSKLATDPLARANHTGSQAASTISDFDTQVGTTAVRKSAGGRETLSTVASSGATETIDLANGNVHDVTLDASCTLTFTGSAASAACSFTLILRQGGSGSYTVTWPASVDWPEGIAPTLSTAVGRVDVFTFLTVDNGTTWLGFTAGLGVR